MPKKIKAPIEVTKRAIVPDMGSNWSLQGLAMVPVGCNGNLVILDRRGQFVKGPSKVPEPAKFDSARSVPDIKLSKSIQDRRLARFPIL